MTHPHLEGLIRKWREIGHDADTWEAAQSFEQCADELQAALAALPGGGVDEAMVERFRHAYEHGPMCSLEIERVRVALTAALPTPNPHEADRNG